MKADRILFRDGVLKREAKILFTEPGGAHNTRVIYESDDPRKARIGLIRELYAFTSGNRNRRRVKFYFLKIDGTEWFSKGITVNKTPTNCEAFKKLQDAKDFATEVFSSVGKDWMKGENHGT